LSQPDWASAGLSARAGAIYFGLVFAVGFALGTVRQLFVVPLTGELTGVLIESPIMVLASYVIAVRVTAQMRVAARLLPRLLMGATAFGLLLAVELALSMLMSGWTLDQWLLNFASAQGAVSLAIFALFGVMPILLLRKPL